MKTALNKYKTIFQALGFIPFALFIPMIEWKVIFFLIQLFGFIIYLWLDIYPPKQTPQ